jgi:hypothetical protein
MFIQQQLKYKLLLTFSLVIAILTGCSQNDSQREFEREAFNLASGITQTNERGEIVEGNLDPDDWRIAPFFQGLVIVDPAFPNPVLSNGRVFINVQVTGIDAVSGLVVYVLHEAGNVPRFIYEEPSRPLMTGLYTISLNPLSIAQFQENSQGIYRIILEDFNRNIITYGDIQIQ